jgi:large subunit ribosomal protein L4
MQIDVLNIQGEKTGRTVDLPEEIFGAEPNDHVIYLAVKQYLAAQRQGTHKVKTRAEVQGASRKLHRQKGTGGSRKGNIRNPLYKGGGTVFGPKPHSYDIKLNRKVKDLAKISALSYKAKNNAIFIVEDITLEEPKTKSFAEILVNMNVGGQKILFVIPEYDDNVQRSFRNIPTVNGILLSDLNTYNVVNADVVVLTEGAAKIFTEEEATVETTTPQPAGKKKAGKSSVKVSDDVTSDSAAI